MVGHKRDVVVLLYKVELDSAQRPCIGFMRLLPGQLDGLICEDHKARGCWRNWYGANNAVLQLVFGAYDKEGTRMAKAHEPGHMNVASVHDVKTAGLQAKMIQKGGIVNTRTCDLKEGWNIAAKVEQRVHFDTRTAFGCRSPIKQAQAQIDGAGVDGIHTLIQVQPKSILAVKAASNTDEVHGKVFKDPAVSSLVGIGQSGAGNLAAKPCVVKLARVTAQAKFNVAKACSRCELGKHHAQELVPVREAERGVAPGIAREAIAENRLWDVFVDLRENKLAFVHGRTSQKSKVCCRAMDYSNRLPPDLEKPHINHEVRRGP